MQWKLTSLILMVILIGVVANGDQNKNKKPWLFRRIVRAIFEHALETILIHWDLDTLVRDMVMKFICMRWCIQCTKSICALMLRSAAISNTNPVRVREVHRRQYLKSFDL